MSIASRKLLRLSVILSVLLAAANARGLQRRIYNGKKAKDNEFNFFVTLAVRERHLCGGALVSKFHVVIAGHCATEIPRPSIPTTIIVGSIYLHQGASYLIKRISRHRDFVPSKTSKSHSDIGMVHSQDEIKLSPEVQPINLPPDNSVVKEGTVLYVAGFGDYNEDEILSSVLMKFKTKTISHEECQEHYSYSIISNKEFCSKQKHGTGCGNGDSGGPVVDASKSTLIGVVAACPPRKPDCSKIVNTYTSVSHFLDYIRSEMRYDEPGYVAPIKHPAVNWRRSRD